MIITETVTINGTQYLHTYSDDGKTILRDGVEYDEAYDPINMGRTYTETQNRVVETIDEVENRLEEAQAKVTKFLRIRATIETLRDEAVLPSTKAIYQAILDLFDER